MAVNDLLTICCYTDMGSKVIVSIKKVWNMKDYGKGWRLIGMQQQMQEAPPKKNIPEIEMEGNRDAKILAKVFAEYAKDGLTQKEKDVVEKVDDIMSGADIVINKEGNKAVIVQEDGKTFNVQVPVKTNLPVRTR